MEMPLCCPCCKSPLMNNFKDFPLNKSVQLEKYCSIKPNHHFWCISRKGCEDEIGIIRITVDMNKMLKFTWIIHDKMLYVTTGFSPTKNLPLPYIEPDLDNYFSLIKKIKKLIPFA